LCGGTTPLHPPHMGGACPPYPPREGAPRDGAPPTRWLELRLCGCCCRRRIDRNALAVAGVRAWLRLRLEPGCGSG
jgi:hypothetical protein